MFFGHNCEFYHSKIEKQTHFPQKIYKLSKTNILFSRSEGPRGEKQQQIFRTYEGGEFCTNDSRLCVKNHDVNAIPGTKSSSEHFNKQSRES